MRVYSFDELNVSQIRSVPYEKYFGEMEISESQKEERIKASEQIESMMLFLFALLTIMEDISYQNVSFAVSQVRDRYIGILGNSNIDDYLNGYVQQFSEQVVQTTMEHKEDEWYFSEDRAMFIAENEANTTQNYIDYKKAIEAGKKKKKWITMRDKHVRHTHAMVDGKTLDISDIFLVGNSEMFYPKDTTFGASANEIVNCRCSVKYF